MNLNKQNMNEAFKALQKLTLEEIKKEFEKDIQKLPKEFRSL